MEEPFNQLTPAEAERLAMLAEEAGEVVQICMKILRHGYASHHPDDQLGLRPNRSLLEQELGDLLGVASYMFRARDIRKIMVIQHARNKRERVYKNGWAHHQPEDVLQREETAQERDWDGLR